MGDLNKIMKAKIQFQDGMHFSGLTESGHDMHWDSGPRDSITSGPAPMEAVLQAVAACSAMDVISIIRKRRKQVDSFEIEVEAEKKTEHPKIFEYVTVTYRMSGDGITTQELEKAVKLSQERYCSVINMIKPNVNVSYRVEIVG
ncbi:osmotically inducible protein OsmC [candidate division LCP-89 bacterium B3_LCP]|uniref:Osmotically inducible protein OsmC n=1 Tax=candidate division LCP-89 bacterium B3_LCP TaxID=2012998 RepID=A0A532UT08_UNCL8|nr:MAG: osmotically inducible protein OsmC [candidate division LCP-89 bacterium B3_LCP]